jgi:hypothetical protein
LAFAKEKQPRTRRLIAESVLALPGLEYCV